MRQRFAIGCLFAALSAASASAPSFFFGGPEVTKLDWATRALTSADINGDGRQDLAVINNDSSRIELLIQRDPEGEAPEPKQQVSENRWDPVLEDARFRVDGVGTGFSLFDLAVGDLNGDGRTDLAYTAREVPLTIRFQGESGSWGRVHESDSFESLGWVDTMQIADLEGDGSNELMVIAADAIRIYRHDTADRMEEPETYFITGENPFNLMLEDVNQDGLKDILYITASGKQSLAVRHQLVDGGFGPERRFIFDRPVRALSVLPPGPSGRVRFGAVDSRSGSLECFELVRATHPDGRDIRRQPQIYPLFKKGSARPGHAYTDVDGDGKRDLVIAHADGAELVVFRSGATGFGAPERFPSFAGVSAIAEGRFAENRDREWVLVSAEEASIGTSRWAEPGRLTFPERIDLGDGAPLAATAVDVNGDGVDVLVVVSEAEGERRLRVLRPAEGGRWESLADHPLDNVRRRPEAIRALDVLGEGAVALMVFVPREPPVLLSLRQSDGFELSPLGAGSPIRENVLKGVRPAEVSVIDAAAPEGPELVVGREGFARAIRVTGDALEMVDQFNARRPADRVGLVLPGGTAQRPTEALVFYEGERGELQRLERDADGVFRFRESFEVGGIDPIAWYPLASEAGGGFLVLGAERFWVLPETGQVWRKKELGSYETELEDVRYTDVRGADFDRDGRLDLLAVDGKANVVEVLSEAEATWDSLMYWKVFEQNMHYQGRTGSAVEPREIVTGDFDHDGTDDFVVLIHDRLLLYPTRLRD